ncbi:hypothetical protein OAJ13_01015 [Euryarchaeota archaeon]|nr:hypothetical protein [Euryarchaeota archaeon]
MLWPGVFDVLNENSNQNSKRVEISTAPVQTRLEKMSSLEWLGQTIASLCWIISVFSYGISTTGDWLQLLAASSWMLSNISSILAIDSNNN